MAVVSWWCYDVVVVSVWVEWVVMAGCRGGVNIWWLCLCGWSGW